MCSFFVGIQPSGSLCFRRGRSSWKSLKNLNTAGGRSLSILRMGLAPLWGGAVPPLVERAMLANQRRNIHAG